MLKRNCMIYRMTKEANNNNDKYIQISASVIIMSCIIIGMLNHLFSFIALILCVILLFLLDEKTYISLLYFLVPFAIVFKSSIDGTSFFTYIELLFVLLHIIRVKGTIKKEQILIVVLTCYIIIGECYSQTIDAKRTIKFVSNLLLLSFFIDVDIDKNYKSVFNSFIVGFILSGYISLIGSSFLPINQYINDTEIEFDGYGGAIIRYSGLYTDPNYFSINLIISLCLSIYLYHKKAINILVLLLYLVSLVFLVGQTGSKSSLFMLSMPILTYLCLNISKQKYLKIFIGSVIICIAVYLVYTGKISIHLFDNAIKRLQNRNNGLAQLTTGRSTIWEMYWVHLRGNPTELIFGNSIGQYYLEGWASHNTYLDFLYQLGIIGTSLYFAVITQITLGNNRGTKRNFANYSVFLTIIIMYFFLSQLQEFDLPFQIALAVICLNLDLMGDVRSENKNAVSYKYIK